MSAGIDTPPGYRPLDEHSLPAFLATLDTVRDMLGGDTAHWQVREVGDGNLNLVFIVTGPAGSVVVKQALPYVRLVGESWPLPLSRAHYEHLALLEQRRHVPALVPRVIHYEPHLALIVMEYLTPHIIMRHGMIDALEYPRFAEDIATFMARTLFQTSDLALTAAAKKKLVGEFSGNSALCKITEDLIFTDPYREAELNRWTSPQLDAIAAEFRQDIDLKVAVSRLKLKFLTDTAALLHGDLHTGSVMVTTGQTRVIDPEFAFCGPMGFDIGAVIANLLISYFSQDGHQTTARPRDDYREWILATTETVWTTFRTMFLGLWRNEAQGDAYPPSLFEGVRGRVRLEAERQTYMDRLLTDALGFCAAKMIRRVLGLAHTIDLESIADADLRARCETRVLQLARELMVNTAGYRDIRTVSEAARLLRAGY